jgi:hypothetical protein
MSGRGIIKTADEGPTTEAMNKRTVADIAKIILRHKRKCGDFRAETKPRDQR